MNATASSVSERADVTAPVNAGDDLKARPLACSLIGLRFAGSRKTEKSGIGEQDAVGDPEATSRLDYRGTRDKGDDRADRDQDRADADGRTREHSSGGGGCLSKSKVSGDHVCGGDGKNGGGEQARSEQTQGEEDFRVAAGDGAGGFFDGVIGVEVEGGAGGDDHEARRL